MTRQQRRQQSKATARAATIHRTGLYTFEIGSRTRPGHTHQIDALRLRCSCEAGQHGDALLGARPRPHDRAGLPRHHP